MRAMAHEPDVVYHAHEDPHRAESRLSDVILGGQDGLVNTLGVILGVAAATRDPHIILAAGLAATFAESFSMGAVAYTSALADHALYQSELERERRHVERVPDLEREEVRVLYRRKGFDGPLLERIVETITADPAVWVAVMMAEELKLAPSSRGGALKTAFVVFAAAMIGSLIPVAPFIVLPVKAAVWVAVSVATATLFAVGAYKAFTTVGHWLKSGLEMAAIGMASAFVGYGIGWLFKVPGG